MGDTVIPPAIIQQGLMHLQAAANQPPHSIDVTGHITNAMQMVRMGATSRGLTQVNFIRTAVNRIQQAITYMQRGPLEQAVETFRYAARVMERSWESVYQDMIPNVELTPDVLDNLVAVYVAFILVVPVVVVLFD